MIGLPLSDRDATATLSIGPTEPSSDAVPSSSPLDVHSLKPGQFQEGNPKWQHAGAKNDADSSRRAR